MNKKQVKCTYQEYYSLAVLKILLWWVQYLVKSWFHCKKKRGGSHVNCTIYNKEHEKMKINIVDPENESPSRQFIREACSHHFTKRGCLDTILTLPLLWGACTNQTRKVSDQAYICYGCRFYLSFYFLIWVRHSLHASIASTYRHVHVQIVVLGSFLHYSWLFFCVLQFDLPS